MKSKSSVVWASLASVLAAILIAPLGAQTPAAAAKSSGTASIPKTADGHPDFQGIWTNATITPMERLPEFAGKLALSDSEAAVFEKRQADNFTLDRRDGSPEADRSRAYNNLFVDRGSELARVDGLKRSSLIIDPPDGKIPAFTPEGRKRIAALRLRGGDEGGGGGGGQDLFPDRTGANANAAVTTRPAGANAGMDGKYDSVKDRPLAERCILGFGSTSGPPMMPVLYNNTYQIVQTPDAIIIAVEMVHDRRVIHMDGRLHLPADVRQWLGDSIGHWEGDTLVVETTNFTEKTTFRGSDQNLKVIERFRRVDAGTILYRVTIDDGTVFTKPWTMEYPFLATAGPVFEYACHEGNYAMPDILGGARRLEKLGEPEK
jgi:hypothetical protein